MFFGVVVPANLPPQAKHKWAEASATKNPKQKLQLLKEFMSLVPKHKGTEKLRNQVKKKMAALRKEIEEKKHKKAGKGGPKYFIEKEGAAQIAIISLTNAGKSSLVATITNAKVEVSPSPYTTREPIPGMFTYKDIQFQIVEAPALMEGSADGKAWGLQTLATARNTDSLIIMINLSQDPIRQLSSILNEMEKARIFISKPKARVEVERKFTLDEVEEAIFESTVYKPAIIVANKTDLEKGKANLKTLETYVGNKLPIVAVSCKTQQGLDKLGEALFKALDIIRVYTKEPNKKEFSRRPFILKKDATVHDLAKNIHSDFKEKFSFAKVWAKRLVFSPQKVGSTFTLEDGDRVEIHMK